MVTDYSGLPRGIDHVGVTVPNMEDAIRFLEKAFGAIPLYRNVLPGKPQKGPETEELLGLAEGTVIREMCMMAIGHGPCIELFEMHGPEQRAAVRPSDFGIQHFAVYVDDIRAACQRFSYAGGHLLTEPRNQPSVEAGPGNLFCYGRTPWGMIIELLSTPSRAGMDAVSPVKRYQPPQRNDS